MKKFLLLALFLITVPAYATNTSRITLRGTIDDGNTKFEDTGAFSLNFTTGAIQVQTVSVDSAQTFLNLSVPTGAKAVLIDTTGLRGLKLKGVTGDTGISLDSSCPILMAISSDNNTTLGILSVSKQSGTFNVWWF